MSQQKYSLSIAIVSLFLLFANQVHGQSAARPERGFHPGGSYSVSDIESINLASGNLNLSIPLASLPPIAGGKLSLTLHATYNSKLWDVTKQQVKQTDEPVYNYVRDWVQLSNSGGWSLFGGYSILSRDSHEDFDWIFPTAEEPDYNYLTQHPAWGKRFVVTPDGAEHELRPLGHTPYPGERSYLKGFFEDNPNNGSEPISYYTMDGSYLWVKIYPTNHPSGLFAEIYTRDGTIVRFSNGLQRIIDTNGNEIRIWSDTEATHFVDWQTQREIKVSSPSVGISRVSYQTVGGTWMNIDIVWGSTEVKGQTYMTRVPKLNGGDCEAPTSLGVVSIPVVLEIISLQTEPGQPARRFTFTYNSDTTEPVNVLWWPFCESSLPLTTSSRGWGSIKQMTMPSGATVNYSYSWDETHELSDPAATARERITSKSVTHDGVTDIWTYSEGAVTNPDGSTVVEGAFPKDWAYSSTAGGAGFDGLSFGTNYSNKILVQRQWQRLVFSGALDNILGVGMAVFNPVVIAEYTSLLDDTPSHNPIKMSAKTYQYDYNGNVLQENHYDWFDPALVQRDGFGVPLAVPAGASLLRTISHSYYNEASSSTSTNVYAKRSIASATPLILNAQQQSTVGPSIVQLSYDGQAYGVAPTAGNLTTKRVWDDLDAKWITTSSSYGLYGNIVTATDARGKITQFFYDDATHALPNRVVVDPQNGTGPQTTTTVYDFSTGVVTSQIDANGQQTDIDYTNQLLGSIDPFGRPGITKSPSINIGGSNHRGRVTTMYLDASRQVIVAADLNAENDQLLKTRTTVDMLGRPVLTENTEDGTNYTIFSRNAYLNMGQVTLSSSAMRSTAGTTDSWTRVTKDTAGRVIEVANFAGASQPAWTGTTGIFNGAVTTAYTANFTTVTDQAGKVRRSMMDALGRLVRVDEPDASGSLGSTTSPVQPTNYSYDVLDNLITVTQGSQTRTFTYDSLSRLRTATNPENGTVSYQYDDNGNLVVKTDARTDPNNQNKKVSTHFEYDALNRVTRRWYNGSNLISDTTHNVPTLPPDVGATAEAKFYYDTQTLPGGAPGYSRGVAIGRLVAETYGTGSNGNYLAYDVLGRQTMKIQQTGTINYQTSAVYNLSGAVTTLTYPSGHTITNSYDQAGRLTTFSGNLGDGATPRTYASGILYSPLGALVKEQFGTSTPVYNKLFYNSRGQLAEIRASTSYTGPGDTTWDRGAIVNNYSDQCTGICSGSSMSDNNGNLKKQQIYIPGHQMRWQQYDYDSLNRLNWVREVVDGGTEQWKQQFTYDRWGNRTINTGVTYGIGINNKAFTVDTATNRLGVPAGQSGTMSYDATGNLTTDTYSGAGNRTYDAENKITSALGTDNQTATYVYDASGQRIKRTVAGIETWQIYGIGGELLAEYPANGAAANPQKEYGYRNGQLLVTTVPPQTTRQNFALRSNGGSASASSEIAAGCSTWPSRGAIDGDRKGSYWGSNGGWADSSSGSFSNDWFQVDFDGEKTIDELDIFTLQDNPNNPSEPTDTMTFSTYGLTAYSVSYWNGSAWINIPEASVVGNNKVWRKFTFSPITTNKIRVYPQAAIDNGYSRLTEVEAWGTVTMPAKTNVALRSNGAVATASSEIASGCDTWPARGANDGDRKGAYWGNTGGWADSSAGDFANDWLQIEFNGNKTINEIDVFTLQDNYANPVEPTETTTFSTYGLTAFDVSYWNGSSWIQIPETVVTGNDKVWRKLTFNPITTSKIRVYGRAASDNGFSRIAEVEAWSPTESSASAGVQWLVTDHLGTPRLILDETGSLENVKRHDYLPFGEELFAPTGGRTTAQGYGATDGLRQQFTAKERDIETGLDYFEARYYASMQGRFTGADEPFADQGEDDPQSWNLYQYAGNSPLLFSDPTGRWKWVDPDKNGKRFLQWEKDDDWQTLATFLNNNSNDTYYKEDLEEAFRSGGLGPETIVDVTGASPRFTNTRGGVTDTSWTLVPISKLPKIVGTVISVIRAFRRDSTPTPTVSNQKIEPLRVKPQDVSTPVPLKPLHKTNLERVLRYWRTRPTEEIIQSLRPGSREALRVKPDGTIMNGNNRIQVLRERGIDVDNLPREPYP